MTILGTGAELVAGLLLLDREGYKLRIDSLGERIRWQWSKGLNAWVLAVIVLVLGMSFSVATGPANQALAVSRVLFHPYDGLLSIP